MDQFIEIKKGLKEEHININPLFEKVYMPPGYGEDMISRLYNDGSLYYLIKDSNPSENEKQDSSWGYISYIEEEGMNMILILIERCCEINFREKMQGNLPGLIRWKLLCNNRIKQVDVRGIPSGDEKLLAEIDDIVSTRIAKI